MLRRGYRYLDTGLFDVGRCGCNSEMGGGRHHWVVRADRLAVGAGYGVRRLDHSGVEERE